MLNTILKAKHWQLFLLTFGIPMIAQFIFMGFMIENFVSSDIGNNPDEVLEMFEYFYLIPIFMVLFMAVYYGWFYAVGTKLQAYIPRELQMNTAYFKAAFFLPVVYILGVSVFVFTILKDLIGTQEPPNLAFLGLMFLFHFIAMGCIFYCMYFAAKTIKLAERKEKVTGSEFVGEFFLIWFFPVGVWILQPTINRIVNEEIEETSLV